MFSRDFTTDLEDFVQPGTGVLHRWGCASAHLLGMWPEMNWVNWDGSRLNQSLTLQCNPCASDQLSTAKLELCFSDKGPRNALKPANSLVHFGRLDLQNTETTGCTSIKVNWVPKLKPKYIAWEGNKDARNIFAMNSALLLLPIHSYNWKRRGLPEKGQRPIHRPSDFAVTALRDSRPAANLPASPQQLKKCHPAFTAP